ncbi:MAG: flavodoxin [Campylobacter sp.]|nr:flavodoxin [Campylobacter sp.]
MKIAIIYGSSMGNTESAAQTIQENLGLQSDLLNVADTPVSELNGYDALICGTSTWGSGDMQDDWEAFDFAGLDIAGKTVALFGVGDSESYSDEFCNGLNVLYNHFKDAGAKIVGETSTDGYTFDSSEAVNKDGNFVGLVLDYDNEDELSESRINAWVEKIKPNFA